MGVVADPVRFCSLEAEQRALVAGGEARLRAYRRLLPGASDGGPGSPDAFPAPEFWDLVVLTAANARQARTYERALDGLFSRGQLPGRSRSAYVVVPDPPGGRVGSGGATLHVMLTLQASRGDASWMSEKILLLHAGGYSERSPAHGTLGKAFGQIPLDAADVGVPATILEAQLACLVHLPANLPPGIFVSSADVVLQLADPPPALDAVTKARCAEGILALGHANPLDVAAHHGVFACDRKALEALVNASALRCANDPRGIETDETTRSVEEKKPAASRDGGPVAGAAETPAGGGGGGGGGDDRSPDHSPPVVLECVQCLQKPDASAMRRAGAVLPPPRELVTTTTGGTRGEWALTDSAFHVGGGACDALVRLAAANPGAFAGVEVCAYGDFMQPMGADPAWAEGDAFVAEGDKTRLATDASEKARRLSAARALLASALRSRPLLVLPLLPSRFVHVGTMPELVHHACADRDVLAALPAPPAGVAMGTWDWGAMGPCVTVRAHPPPPPNASSPASGSSRASGSSLGVSGHRSPRVTSIAAGGSVGADGVWGSGRTCAPGACVMASVLRRGSRVGAGSVLAHCDVGILATVGAGCLLHDVDLANGADVPPGVFLHCVPLRPEAEEGMRGGGAALFGGGEGRRAAPSEGPSGRGGKRKGRRTLRRGLGAGAWTCIVLDVRDEVKSATASTLCGVPVAEAARRLGLDPSAGAAVWADGEARTTTNARVFPVRASAADAVAAALETRRAIKKPAGGAAGSHHGGAPTTIPSASSPPRAASPTTPDTAPHLNRSAPTMRLQLYSNSSRSTLMAPETTTVDINSTDEG